jgi:NAD(P)-dependent dehydrogenase (short-subunit alcohol dehydrogenase family)
VAWAPAGIRVNALAPGWFATELSRSARSGTGEFQRKLMDRLPIRRWAEPEELSGVALFLASPAAQLITGTILPVDGGYSAA